MIENHHWLVERLSYLTAFEQGDFVFFFSAHDGFPSNRPIFSDSQIRSAPIRPDKSALILVVQRHLAGDLPGFLAPKGPNKSAQGNTFVLIRDSSAPTGH